MWLFQCTPASLAQAVQCHALLVFSTNELLFNPMPLLAYLPAWFAFQVDTALHP